MLLYIKRLEKYIPEDFFTWMNLFYKMKAVALPRGGLGKEKLYTVYFSFHISMIVLLLILEWIEFFRVFSENLKRTMYNLSVCVLDSIIVLRIIIWLMTEKEIERIKNVIRRKSFDMECFNIVRIDCRRESFQKHVRQSNDVMRYEHLSEIWKFADVMRSGRSNQLEAFRKQTMLNTRMLCCFLYLSICFTCVLTNMIAFLSSAISKPTPAFNARLNKTSTYKSYPYDVYLPFDTSYSDGYYWLGFWFQQHAYLGSILSFLPVDTTITNIIIHLISQTTVISEAFKYVDQNIDANQCFKNVLLIKRIRITKCISELQEIYRAIDMLEDLCNVQLLFQYGAAIFILCSLCYVIPLLNQISDVVCSFLFLSASLGEIFFFTYCCQTLSIKLQNVNYAISNLDWANYPPSMRKDLVFLLHRIHKPASLTGGKIINLDLLFFIQVLQKSYSFYTLISKTST